MMDEVNDPRSQVVKYERHLQTVVVIVVTAILLWVGKTVQDMSVSVAKLEVQVSTLAASPHPVDASRLVSLEARILNLENSNRERK